MLTFGVTAIAVFGLLGAPDRPRPAIRRIDRAHVVGAPILDEQARSGVYVWREDGLYRFAVVGPSSATTEFQVRASGPVEVIEGEGIVWQRQAARHFIARTRSGRGALRCKGHLKIGRARRGKRKVRVYVGPLAQRAASTIEIGAFGALKSSLSR